MNMKWHDCAVQSTKKYQVVNDVAEDNFWWQENRVEGAAREVGTLPLA